jgi:hypothetical protein
MYHLYSLVEGVDKSLLIELIEKIIDEKHTFAITDVSNHLFGKHSMVEFEKLFITLNEIEGKDTYTNCKTVRQQITDGKRDFEPKGLKEFNGVNYANYMCSTKLPPMRSIQSMLEILTVVFSLLLVIKRKPWIKFTSNTLTTK